MRAAVLLLLALAAAPAATARDLVFRDASSEFDFVAHLDGACPEAPDVAEPCVLPATLDIRRHGEAKLLQAVPLAQLRLEFDDEGRIPTQASVLAVADFNFDGHEDFAVRDGADADAYAVFLFDPARTRFEASATLSALTRDGAGLFEVDAASKRLRTHRTSGCCHREIAEYATDSGAPVATFRRSEDVLDGDGSWRSVQEQRLVEGRWRVRTWREPMDDQPGD